MRIYQRLTALTAEEQRFAADNHGVIDWFFRITNHDRNEYYDVAAIGYLKAVKSWCSREELHCYSFATIAKRAMETYIWNDRKKNDRRIRTISLDAHVGEKEDFTLGETITYDNYLNQYLTCYGGDNEHIKRAVRETTWF